MQNKWAMGPKRDFSKQTTRKLSQDEIRFRRQEENRQLAQKKDHRKEEHNKIGGS